MDEKEQEENLEYGRRRIRRKPLLHTKESEKSEEQQKAGNSGNKEGDNRAVPKNDKPQNIDRQLKIETTPITPTEKSPRIEKDESSKKGQNSQRRESVKGEVISRNIRRRLLKNEEIKPKPRKKVVSKQRKIVGRSRRLSSTPKISIIIPAHNEAKSLPILMEHIKDMFAGVDYTGEVIIVDDGSTDNTAKVLENFKRKYGFLRTFRHATNLGLTAALETGFSHAKGRIFVFYPADLQYLPNDIPKMIKKIDEGADIVCGWRQGSYGTKRFVSYFYNMLSKFLFKVKVHDLNSVKAFRREVVDAITFRKDWHRYMVVMAADKGFSVDEVKVKLYPRRYGKSNFGSGRIFAGFFDLISVKFQLTFLKKPMLLFGMGGLISGLAGIIVGLIALYYRFVLNEGLRPLLYLVILLVLSGLVLFAMGFLAEILVLVLEDLRALRKGNNQK